MEIFLKEWGETIGAILSALMAFVGFPLIFWQLRQANRNLRQSNHTAIYNINTELYKFMAENSDLRPYFYDGVTPSNEDINRVLSVSELLADFFEFILIEKQSLAPQIRDPWMNYMKKIYQKSPGFRMFIDQNKKEYCDELIETFSEQ